jgi:hypothetical protein
MILHVHLSACRLIPLSNNNDLIVFFGQIMEFKSARYAHHLLSDDYILRHLQLYGDARGERPAGSYANLPFDRVVAPATSSWRSQKQGRT